MECPNLTSVTEFVFLAFSRKSTTYPTLWIFIFLLLYIIIVIGNILMILVIKVDNRLHTPMYFFVSSLSCFDILSISSAVPQIMCNLLRSRSSISYINCAAQMCFYNIFGAMQIMIISVMAYDRYVAISQPLHYKAIMSWKVCTLSLCTVWIIVLMLVILVVILVFTLPYCGRAEVEHFFCDAGQILALNSADKLRQYKVEFLILIEGVVTITAPFTLVFISYIYIVFAILKIRTNHGRYKAFSTCSSHLSLLAVEFSCLGFIYFRPKEALTLDKDKIFVMIFVFSTPLLNPIVFTLRNNAVKKGFLKLMSIKIC